MASQYDVENRRETRLLIQWSTLAASNKIIGESLEGNPAYLQWLFIDQLKDTKDQVIYVPSRNMGLPILEAPRLIKPTPTAEQ